MVRQLRNWLSTELRRTTIPPTQRLLSDCEQFENDFPATVVAADFDENTMTFSDLCLIVEAYIRILIYDKMSS